MDDYWNRGNTVPNKYNFNRKQMILSSLIVTLSKSVIQHKIEQHVGLNVGLFDYSSGGHKNITI